ncbi:MAG TPA: DUF2062 domain-containing protein [Polyangiaceae bacterium]|jgi:uncharacterized protein (DUF2062 family)
MLRRWPARLRTLWRLATTERASPRQIALAFGVGAFIGSTPVIGFHGWIAVGTATALRLNRLYTFLGSRVSSPVVLPFIVLAEIEIAHRIRCGAFLALDRHDVLAHAKTLLLDWILGTIPVGLAVGLVCGALGFAVATLRSRLPRGPRSTSECPPSNSPDRSS